MKSLLDYFGLHYFLLRNSVYNFKIFLSKFLELALNIFFYIYYFQFCFLHAFFWMNVMSFDIFQKFRKSKSRKSETRSSKLLYYSIYAIGSPLVILSITIVLEFLPDSYGGLRANFGQRLVCFFIIQKNKWFEQSDVDDFFVRDSCTYV